MGPRGSHSAPLRAGEAAMLLGLCLAQSAPPQTCSAPQQNVTQPQYQNTIEDNGSGFMAALVHSFLNSVQPQPFPGDLILNITDMVQKGQISQKTTTAALVYEIGFLVGAAVGVLYIVLMPLVGLFVACCRCCGNCGGTMYQKQTSSLHCRRRALYWSAFVATAVILAGNICMFISNANFKVSVQRGPGLLNTSIDNINTFVTAVPQQIGSVVNESQTVIDDVINNLNNIGPELGSAIQQRMTGTLGPVLSSLSLLDRETANVSVLLNALNSSLVQLQSSVNLLQSNLTSVRGRINDTLSDPNCIGCGSHKSELQTLTLNISVNVPGLSTFQSAVNEVVAINLTSKRQVVSDFFNSIPQMVTNNTMTVVQSSKQQLTNIETQISQVTSKIPLSSLNSLSNSLTNVQTEINRVVPQVQSFEFIRWSVTIAICCVVLLVVVCNVLGLVLGPLGLSPRADPTKRSCVADCGGTFLMMGAGFSFLVSWLFMIVVLVLFLVGGNVYTLICRPWSNGQLLQFIDNSFLAANLQSLGLNSSLSISEIYTDCENNQPVWTTLRLYELINLNDYLNVSKYTAQIQQQFDSTNMNLSSINLLNPQVESQLRNFSANALNVDTTAFTQQTNNISSINLNTTANVLDNLAANITNTTIKQQLNDEATNLRQLQINIETIILPQVRSLNLTILSLTSLSSEINQTVGGLLQSVGVAQGFLNTNVTQIVRTESRTFLNCQLSYFTAFAQWANTTITQQVGRCRPVAGAIDTAQEIVCLQIVESLNAFWFSLGWCLMFFIPSIIFSMKLAKYYRRMKSTDVYENEYLNHISMTHIPRAQMKVT
ncbi:prominin-2 [Betta splendens]|uniref:Prominin-2 n=1 Tax=Betta splendens TaxID=158456 RepID=A0A6P7KLJ8_BETSP|nr:prominin-2 [Betta splendens]XP_028983423.1 prominin-2 [Betta splendens]